MAYANKANRNKYQRVWRGGSPEKMREYQDRQNKKRREKRSKMKEQEK